MSPATRVPVSLGARSYDVVVGDDLLREAGALIAPFLTRKRVFVAADENAEAQHGEALRQSLAAADIDGIWVKVPSGEGQKSFAGIETMLDAFLAAGIERKDFIIAFGGGVVGDLAGFAAAIVKRGVDFIQIPTTLLSQVDSSVGGKTAINATAGKNLVGVFHQPRLVIADSAVLKTLPARELRAGLAEIIKYGLIDDPDFFAWVAANAAGLGKGETSLLAEAVRRSVAAKARVVAIDEHETGPRALLNLGHTFAHAIEACAGMHGKILHGEAVGAGLSAAFRFSHFLGLCPEGECRKVDAALAALGLETNWTKLPGAPFAPEALLEAMRHDKKNSGGALTFILANGIGESFIDRSVDAGKVEAFLQELVV
ncbi:MAG: 3-dehydroquinate synthase [Caulobacterales bacterium]